MTQPHEQRVLSEHADLAEKISKLTAFTATDFFQGLEDTDRILLLVQMEQMTSYLNTLQRRINRFN